MAVVLGLFEPGVAVNLIAFGSIELAAPAIARRPVTLDIAQMRLGSAEAFALERDEPRLHDDAALAKGGVAVARREHAADARAAANPARSEERSVGKECVSTFRSRWSQDSKKKKNKKTTKHMQ